MQIRMYVLRHSAAPRDRVCVPGPGPGGTHPNSRASAAGGIRTQGRMRTVGRTRPRRRWLRGGRENCVHAPLTSLLRLLLMISRSRWGRRDGRDMRLWEAGTRRRGRGGVLTLRSSSMALLMRSASSSSAGDRRLGIVGTGCSYPDGGRGKYVERRGEERRVGGGGGGGKKRRGKEGDKRGFVEKRMEEERLSRDRWRRLRGRASVPRRQVVK